MRLKINNKELLYHIEKPVITLGTVGYKLPESEKFEMGTITFRYDPEYQSFISNWVTGTLRIDETVEFLEKFNVVKFGLDWQNNPTCTILLFMGQKGGRQPDKIELI